MAPPEAPAGSVTKGEASQATDRTEETDSCSSKDRRVVGNENASTIIVPSAVVSVARHTEAGNGDDECCENAEGERAETEHSNSRSSAPKEFLSVFRMIVASVGMQIQVSMKISIISVETTSIEPRLYGVWYSYQVSDCRFFIFVS